MPTALSSIPQPFFTINPEAKATMQADVYIDKGRVTAVSFDDDVLLTVKDKLGNEDSVTLSAFPISMGLDSCVDQFKVDTATVMHGMFG